jgi:hypothetical protein
MNFLLQMITDLFFLAGTNSAARLHSTRGAQVYYYLFDYRGSNSFSTVATNSTADYGECLQYVEQANICIISQPSPVAWIRFGIQGPRCWTHTLYLTLKLICSMPRYWWGYSVSTENVYGLDDRGSTPSRGRNYS